LRAKYPEGALKAGGPRQVPRLHSLKNQPLYITLTMILYENMKLTEHFLLQPICALSHLMCTCYQARRQDLAARGEKP